VEVDARATAGVARRTPRRASGVAVVRPPSRGAATSAV